HQRFKILWVDWAPIRSPRQSRKNLLRTRFLLRRIRGPASQDLSHAGRVLGTLGDEWSGNPEEANHRIILQLRNTVVIERLSLVFFNDIETGPVVRLQKSCPDDMRTSLNGNGDVDRAIVLPLHSLT